MDDVFIIGDPKLVAKAFVRFSALAKRAGLEVRNDKCKVFGKDSESVANEVNIQNCPDSITILSSCICYDPDPANTENEMAKHLDSKLVHYEKFFNVITNQLVPNEVQWHAVRRYARLYLCNGAARLRVLLKVDKRNAFNSCLRSDFLKIVRDEFPALYNYAVACYGETTLLLFAGIFLSSRAGVHQGDPLGPLLFALALTAILDEINAEALELNAWYLDDGAVGGTLKAVKLFLEALISKAAERDLHLNIAKCEIVCADDKIEVVREAFAHLPDLKIVPASRLFLLGTPLRSMRLYAARSKQPTPRA